MPRSIRLRLAGLLAALCIAPPAFAQQTFTVTTTADDGAGSLRAAVTAANATPERDVIAFAIGGGGSYQEIALDSAVVVRAPVEIDGNTQGCDTDDGLCIRLDGDSGTAAGFYGLGFVGASDGSTVRGLVFTRFGRVASDDGSRSGGLFIDAGGLRIVGNYFGTDRTGLVTDPDGTPGSGDEFGNGFGIVINSRGGVIAGVEIGEPGGGNVIAGSIATAIKLTGDHVTGTRIRSNHIGVGSDGTTPLGNLSHGVDFDEVGIVGDGNQIGGLGDAEGNLIIGSTGAGGVLIDGTDSTFVYGNVISGNDFGGVQMQDGSSGNTIEGNLIGLAPGGSAALPNGTVEGLARFEGFGVTMVSGASDNAVRDNTISGNLLGGVLMGGTSPGAVTGNVVVENTIGLGSDGVTVVPNGIEGIEETGAGVVFFGAADAVTENEVYFNTISANTTAGIVMDGAGTMGNLVYGNVIGIDGEGDPAPNGQAGVLIRAGAGENLIGGSLITGVNLIMSNPVSIALAADAGTGNIVADNIMAASLFNIDLGADGPTANDPADADEGPNRLQNTPLIQAATFSSGTLTLTYSVDTAPENATYPLTLQLYAVEMNEGLTDFNPLRSATPVYAESDAQQTVTQTFTLSGDETPPEGALVVAAVTDAAGNTSEVTTAPVTVAAEAGEDAEALRLSLAPNAPNPFAGTTQIAFTLDAAGPVSLDVYDLLGRRVATLLEGVQPRGEHTTTFDASALPSGTYVYRLRTQRGTVTRTMVLVR